MMVSATDILNASVLIVDDQASNVRLLEQLLSKAGYTSVASTTNPQDVWAPHRENPFDLFLAEDLAMGPKLFIQSGRKERAVNF